MLDMTECQKIKILNSKSYLQVCYKQILMTVDAKISRELEELKMLVSANAPKPFSSQETVKEFNKWDCIDLATRFFNTLSVSPQGYRLN